ncbi:hypothetical protein [Nocardioides sp. B-3]|uniref:hypothetical protein n=1 Tax=Nocardioides sp. B-3 TaxID=2895565 RepID=UPI002151FF61|nr:hypothetical protein [Nocardioides sp. B-3]UUZ61349.1 hypothetical protein LP418_12665 [Nocardioides sp. B-3]
MTDRLETPEVHARVAALLADRDRDVALHAAAALARLADGHRDAGCSAWLSAVAADDVTEVHGGPGRSSAASRHVLRAAHRGPGIGRERVGGGARCARSPLRPPCSPGGRAAGRPVRSPADPRADGALPRTCLDTGGARPHRRAPRRR